MTSTTSNFEEKRRALLDKSSISTSIRTQLSQPADPGNHVTGPDDHVVDRMEKLRALRIGKAASNLNKIKERITIDPTSLKPSSQRSTRKGESKILSEATSQEGEGETDSTQNSTSIPANPTTFSPIATHKLPSFPTSSRPKGDNERRPPTLAKKKSLKITSQDGDGETDSIPKSTSILADPITFSSLVTTHKLPSLPTSNRPKGHTNRRPPTLAKKRPSNSEDLSTLYDLPSSLFPSDTHPSNKSAKSQSGFESRIKTKAATSPDLKKSRPAPTHALAGPPKIKLSPNLLAQGQSKLKHAPTNLNRNNNNHNELIDLRKNVALLSIFNGTDAVTNEADSGEKSLLPHDDLMCFNPAPFNFIDD